MMQMLSAESRRKLQQFEHEKAMDCLLSVGRDSVYKTQNGAFAFLDKSVSPREKRREGEFNLSVGRPHNDIMGKYSITHDRTGLSNKPKSFHIKDHKVAVKEVTELLATIFENKLLSLEEHSLTVHQKELILCVVYKLLDKVINKFGKSNKQKQVAFLSMLKEKRDGRDLGWIQEQVLNSDRILIRRKEEKLKFIMKNVIKHFRKQFFVEKGLKMCRQSEMEFLNSFYAKHKEAYGMEVENFSDPLNCTLINNPTYKTLNSEYFDMIFSLEDFRDTFFAYLDGEFKKNYQASVPAKFTKMFKELLDKLESSLHVDEEDIFVEYIDKYKQQKNNKLPWLGKEIDDAILVFKRHVRKYATTTLLKKQQLGS